MTKPLLSVENLAFSYPKYPVFSDINFTLNKSEIFVLLGPNGCGKTTLINCILKLLKPNKGSIKVNDINLGNLKPFNLSRYIAFVPQSHTKTFPYTVAEIVLMGRAATKAFYSAPSQEDYDLAIDALKKVGLEHLASKPYTNLSGGETQLVLLSRAIAQQSDIIIMDEPTSHLDCYNELIVLERVTETVMQEGKSIIMTTHQPNQIFHMMLSKVDIKTALMKKGSFLAMGKPQEVITESNIQSLYNITAQSVTHTSDLYGNIQQIVPLKPLDKGASL